MIGTKHLANKIICAATNNENKLKEIREILNSVEIRPSSYFRKDFHVDETGSSFCENAYLKAKHMSSYADIVIADDSGLEVFALNNEPGINSKRYSKEATDESNVEKLLKAMENISDRRARFTCCIVAIVNGEIVQKEGFVYGTIKDHPAGGNGFGYDPVFIPNGYEKTFAEMKKEVKNSISHRKNALELVKKELIIRSLI